MISTRKDFIGRVLAERPALKDPSRPMLVGVKPVDTAARLRAGAHLLLKDAGVSPQNDHGYLTSAAYSVGNRVRATRGPRDQHSSFFSARVQRRTALLSGLRARSQADRRNRALCDDRVKRGAIIEQAVERVDHSMSVQQLTTLGNEVESVVLDRAIQWHAEHRVFAFGGRTVVLR